MSALPPGPSGAQPRVRRATAADALVVAALRLQQARASGAQAEPGFLDRFAAAWDAQDHPTWVAELDGSHAGLLLTTMVDDLPWPGGARRLAHVVSLYVAPYPGDDGGVARRDGVRRALLAELEAWAHAVGVVLQGNS